MRGENDKSRKERFRGVIPIRGSGFAGPIGKKARRMDPIVPVYGDTPCVPRTAFRLPSPLAPSMVTVRQSRSNCLLDMSLPMPNQDEHLPDQIEASVHQAGLEIQRRLYKVLMEKADQELVLQRRHGKGGAGIQRRGTRPFTFKTVFGNVTVRRSRICHKYDGTMEVPSAIAWNTSHQLHITQNLRDAGL